MLYSLRPSSSPTHLNLLCLFSFFCSLIFRVFVVAKVWMCGELVFSFLAIFHCFSQAHRDLKVMLGPYKNHLLLLLLTKHSHIIPVFLNLHWLSISSRFIYKLLFIVFKSLNGQAPTYILDMLKVYKPSRPSKPLTWKQIASWRNQISSYLGGQIFFYCSTTSLESTTSSHQNIPFPFTLSKHLSKHTSCR